MPGQPYTLSIDGGKLKALLDIGNIPDNAKTKARLGLSVRNAAEMVRTRAVYNVGGYPVNYDGRVFRVSVRTGALRGSIEVSWPYSGPLVARVFVNGTHTAVLSVPGVYSRTQSVSDYAGAIEWGHDEIDLKKTMMGKTVPFFASRGSKTVGPYAARGLDPVDPNSEKAGFVNQALNAKLAAKGKNPMVFAKKGSTTAYAKKGGQSYYIAFRKVGKTGWVIPKAEPRPFMAAAFAGTQDNVRRMMVRETAAFIREHLK